MTQLIHAAIGQDHSASLYIEAQAGGDLIYALSDRGTGNGIVAELPVLPYQVAVVHSDNEDRQHGEYQGLLAQPQGYGWDLQMSQICPCLCYIDHHGDCTYEDGQRKQEFWTQLLPTEDGQNQTASHAHE
jgi:hypothetical protein